MRRTEPDVLPRQAGPGDLARRIGAAIPLRGQQRALVVLIIALAVFFTWRAPGFLSDQSLGDLLRSASMFGIVGLGMTIVIISCGSFGGIDLSVGSMMAFGGALGAGLLGTAYDSANPLKLPFLLSVVIAMVVSGLLGALNGGLIARLRLAPFAVTLGALTLIRGLTYVVVNFFAGNSSGAGITFINPGFDWLGISQVGPLPSVVFVFLGLAIVVALVLRYTVFGRNLFVLGGGKENARLAGINVTRTIIIVFAVSGLLAGLGGLLLTGRLSSASPLAANGYELDVIMVAVIGGTSLSGGRGSILGTVLAAIMVSEIDNGLDLMNMQSFQQYLVKGVILVAAVVLDKIHQRRTSRTLVGTL